jgi:hypothetical protein
MAMRVKPHNSFFMVSSRKYSCSAVQIAAAKPATVCDLTVRGLAISPAGDRFGSQFIRWITASFAAQHLGPVKASLSGTRPGLRCRPRAIVITGTGASIHSGCA